MGKSRHYYGSKILKALFSALLSLLLINTASALTTNNWKGVSADWNTATNWSTGLVPGSGDAVQIGVSTAFKFQPVISAGATNIIGSLTIGTNNSTLGAPVTLTVNVSNSLTVNGALIQNPSNTGSYTSTLAGAGGITCASIQVGNTTTFPPVLAVDLTQVTSTIANLHVTGSVTVNATDFAVLFVGVGFINATFSLQGGTAVIDGTILTTTTDGGILPLLAPSPKFSLDIPSGSSQSPILQLTNAAPINTSSVAGSIDFYNNTGGTGTATVNYNYGSTNQEVYTASTSALNSSPQVYQYLTLSGTGSQRADAGSLTTGQDITSSSTVDLNTNNPTISVGNSWTNSGNVTQGSGTIAITNTLQNTSGTFQLGTGNTTTSTLQNSGGTVAGGTGPGTIIVSTTFQNNGGTYQCNAEDLYVNGSYQNTSTFTAGSGTVFFNGTAQTLTDASSAGTLFNNVTFSNSGTKTMSSGSFGVSTTGVLSVLGASTILAPGGNLTMYASSSSPLVYAQIAPVTGKISGNVNYQVYFTGGAGYRNYRSMASPVYNNTSSYSSTNGTYTLASLINSFIITGVNGSTNGFDKSTNNGATLRIYNTATNIYTFITSLLTAPTVSSGTAFYMYFRGSRTPTGTVTAADPFGSKTNRNDGGGSYATADPVMYTYTGVPNQGSLAAPTFAATDSRYYYLANPYAATLDANAIITSALISGTTYYVNTKTWIWSPSAANYAVYNFTTPAMSTNGAKQYIVPGQGFFIQANTTGTAKTLTITEAMKSVTNSSNAARFLYQAEPLAAADPPILRLKYLKDTVLSDEIAIAFIDSSKATMDNQDATHLEGSSLTLSSLTTDNQYLANDVRPFTGNKTTFQLYITPTQDTVYTIKLSYKNTLMNNFKICLQDSLLNTTTDITNNPYTFSVVSAQANTYAKRFKLIVEPQPPSPAFIKFTAQLNPVRQVFLHWNVIGNRSKIKYQVQRSIDNKTFADIGSPVNIIGDAPAGSYQILDQSPLVGLNYYRLVQTDMFNDKCFSDTVTIANNPGLLNGIAKNGFVLYSNPVKDVLAIVSDKSYPGTVKLQIYNNMGQMQKSQSFTGMSAQVPIQKDISDLKLGVYTAHITNNNKEMAIIKFIKE
ncbi:MAG: hypothetical protein M3O71_29725 [Bacteroidota bacterium]|nr:hypothetical protein [Bacteroidota bacterium]